ncbi:hypothetical protein SK128_001058 [Halocaridina rubra]|uniref:Uncharacterized protein n=1 Tax=Halocaridina rubra TaxID=373956 RepID=A0AAN8WHV6_HALRR
MVAADRHHRHRNVNNVGIMAALSCPSLQNNNTATDVFISTDVTYENITSEGKTMPRECYTENGTNATAATAAAETEHMNVTTNVTAIVVCPLVPTPEMESFAVHDISTFLLLIGIFITYCCIYFILSVCVIVGAFWRSPRLLQGWVALTSLHMVIVFADLLYTLAHTTLLHLCTSLALFVLALYTWAVVRSFMHTLIFEKKQPQARKSDATDYTVDGVDIEGTPIQV